MKCNMCGHETIIVHNMDDCIKALRRCHDIACRALVRIRAITKAVVGNDKVTNHISSIVEMAIEDLGKCVEEGTPS